MTLNNGNDDQCISQGDAQHKSLFYPKMTSKPKAIHYLWQQSKNHLAKAQTSNEVRKKKLIQD